MSSPFSEQEWRTLQIAPMWVFQVVAKADGSIDDEESSMMVDKIYAGAETSSALAKDVLKSVADAFDTAARRYYADERKPLDGLREVGELIAAKAPEERQPFADAMVAMGRSIAESIDKEGAGDDESEAATLDSIREALGG